MKGGKEMTEEGGKGGKGKTSKEGWKKEIEIS